MSTPDSRTPATDAAAGPERSPESLPVVPLADLRADSVRSGVAQLGSRAAQLVLLVGSGMLLARLLTPTDFGLLAMASVVTGIADSVRHFGLPQAALHRGDLSTRQANALFWRTLELSCMTALAIAVASPLIAAFYGEPRVIEVMLVFALAYAIQGSTALHEAVLMRRLRFGGVVAAELGALAAATAIGLLLAWRGAGYRALVAQVLVLAVVHAAVLWSVCRWRPGGRPDALSRTDARHLLAYGSDVTRFQILQYAGTNADRALVGAFSGARSLGFYDAAYRWSLYPVQQIYAPLTSVALASLARVQDDANAYRRGLRSGLLPIFTLIIPALAFLALEAERTILILLGDQWGPAVPLFRILCIGGIASSVIKVTRWLFLAEGQTRQLLRWALIYMPFMVVAAALGIPWGPTGVAVGYSAGVWLMAPFALHVCLRNSPVRPTDFVAVAARPALAAVIAVTATALVDASAPMAMAGFAGALTLFRQFGVFIATFAAVWIALPGGRMRMHELVTLLRAGRRGRTVQPTESRADL